MTAEQTAFGTRRPRILALDDEEPVRLMLDRLLTKAGYDHLSVGDLASAREALIEDSYDLLLCDIGLDGESGLDLVRQIHRDMVDTAVVMVTGDDDPGVASIAVTLGAYGYLVKPFSANEVLIQIDGALRRRELERVRRFHLEELESKVLERSTSLHAVFGRLDDAEADVADLHREMADQLTSALSLRDEETGQHIERVGHFAVRIARQAGITRWPDDELMVAAMLHDVGKIAVPDLVLLKPGPLSPSEHATMRRHAEAGHRLLDGASARILRLGASIALTHHERFDGTGYPQGLAGEAIPLEGRITALADAFDAMTSARVYRPAMPVDTALELMSGQRGGQFDPDLLDAFLAAIDDILAIRTELSDRTDPVSAITVLLVDDHTMFAETAVRILDRAPGIAVVGSAPSVAEAVLKCGSVMPDVVVSEWVLPDGTGADVARRVREVNPAVAVVVLTDAWDERLLFEAVEAGCAGCIGKHRPFEELTAAVRSAAAGDALVSPGHLVGLLRRMRPKPMEGHAANLTGREREVLGLIAQGLSTDAIAHRLAITANTVRNHSQRIITKLGAHSRLEAVATGVRAGLVMR